MARSLISAAAAGTLATCAQAQIPASAWTVDVGAIARQRPVHLGSPRYTADLLPILSIDYGDKLSISLDDGAKATVWRDGPWSAGPVLEYRQSYNDRLPRRAFPMDDAVEAGAFAARRTPVGEIELRLRKAVSGYGGWSGDLAFDTGGRIAPKWKLGLETRLSWADSAFSREYFGLRPHTDVGMTFPRVGENDFFSAGVQLDAARAIGRRTSIVATFSDDYILGEEWSSALLKTRHVATAGLGLVYRFGSGETGD